MSSEARIQQTIENAVRRATEPLERAVEELSTRLAALEGSGGAAVAEPAQRPVRGRTAKARAQSAEAAASADTAAAGGGGKPLDEVPKQRGASE